MRDYCSNKDHKNDPDWSYTADGCPYCQIETLRAEVERLKSFEAQCFELDKKCTEYKRLSEINASVIAKLYNDNEPNAP